MTVPVLLDARILAYNDTGIAQYVRHLYQSMRDVVDHAIRGGEPPPVAVTVLESRREKRHQLSRAWPDTRVAWTPPHHRLERWALAAEVGATTLSLDRRQGEGRSGRTVLHSPDHVAPRRFRLLAGRRWRSVITVHDLSFVYLPETHTPESRSYYSGIKSAALTADAIICPSQATASDLLDSTGVDPGRVWVVHEAADPRYQPSKRPENPLTDDGRPYILTVGSIERRKNFKILVEAVRRMPPERRPLVKIVGTKGSAFPEIARLVSSNQLDRWVSFMGRMGTKEIVALYHNALASTYLSLYEGFGLPVLESMASGCPVVASNLSSIPEVAGDAAILVDPNDADAVASALLRLVDDPSHRADLRERGLTRAAMFTWTAAAQQTIDVFRAVHA
jgi:glycosyltransferase involved in cell wall biosynthesis